MRAQLRCWLDYREQNWSVQYTRNELLALLLFSFLFSFEFRPEATERSDCCSFFSRSLLLHSVSSKLLLLLPHIHCKYRFLFLMLCVGWLLLLNWYKQPSLQPKLTGFRLLVLYMRARHSSQNCNRTQEMRCKKSKIVSWKKNPEFNTRKIFQSSPVHFENQEANNWKNSQYAFKIQLLV